MSATDPMTRPPPAVKRRPRSDAPTMRDVAKAAGVSQTAVSFVLNGRTDMQIAEETRERIWRVIGQLGYKPNAIAQNLRSGQSMLLGLVTDEIATTPFAGDIVRGAQDAAWEHGRVLTLVNTDRRAGLESEAVAALVRHRVEGLVFATMFHHETTLPGSIGGVPVVLVNCYSADATVPCAVPDEEQGGHAAAAHLIACGHRDIGFLNFAGRIPAAAGREAGFRRALAEAGIALRGERIAYGPTSDAEGGYVVAREMMAGADRPGALFVFNDRMAMGTYDALRELGLRVPDDVSVVSFDNQEIIAAHLRPGLTSVALPHEALGRWGVQALLGLTPLDGPVRLPCPLVERGSVRRLG